MCRCVLYSGNYDRNRFVGRAAAEGGVAFVSNVATVVVIDITVVVDADLPPPPS